MYQLRYLYVDCFKCQDRIYGEQMENIIENGGRAVEGKQRNFETSSDNWREW